MILKEVRWYNNYLAQDFCYKLKRLQQKLAKQVVPMYFVTKDVACGICRLLEISEKPRCFYNLEKS